MTKWLATAALVVLASLAGTAALTSGDSGPETSARQPDHDNVRLGNKPAKPNSKDSDHDGLPDSWERRYNISTNKKSGKQDPDHDQLTNRREYRLRTNPRKRDTDRDGYSDKTEVRKGTDPRDPRSHPGFPNPASTGVPPGWEPKEVQTTDLHVTKPGTVIQDMLVREADILVEADDVTIRRVKLQGGVIINQFGSDCGTGLVIEDTTIEQVPGTPYTPSDYPVIGEGGYTARRVEIENRGEGFRASDCGPVKIIDSFAYILADSEDCGRDFHSDGVQGYYARGLTITNSALIFGNDCGTSPYFIGRTEPPINTGKYVVDGLLVANGGYVFRQGAPASVTGLRIVNRSWLYGPIDVRCSVMEPWEAKIVEVDSDYQVTRVVRNQPCNTEGGD